MWDDEVEDALDVDEAFEEEALADSPAPSPPDATVREGADVLSARFVSVAGRAPTIGWAVT